MLSHTQNQDPLAQLRNSHWRIGQIMGVPLFVAPSLLLIAAILLVAYAPLVQRRIWHLTALESYLAAVVFVVLLLSSIFLHELAHAIMARRLGVPVKAVTLWMFGGHTETHSHSRSPKAELAISLAGPGASLMLGCVGAFMTLIVGAENLGGELAGQLAVTNMAIVLFNLLPGLPLDGGAIVRAVVWRVSGNRNYGNLAAGWTGQVVAVFMLAGALTLMRDKEMGLNVAVMVAALGFSVFLWFVASQSVRAAKLNQQAKGLTVHELMRHPVMVWAETSLDQALRQASNMAATALVVVDRAGLPTGIVVPAAVTAMPPYRYPWVPVWQVARKPVYTVDRQLAGAELLRAVERVSATEYLVCDKHANSQVAGVLFAEDLSRALALSRRR